MSAGPESFVLLGQVVIAAGAVGAVAWPIVKAWGKKADKHTVTNQINEVKLEQGVHRQHIGKLFDKLDEHSRRDEELAREVLGTMATNHAELLRELGKKVDR